MSGLIRDFVGLLSVLIAGLIVVLIAVSLIALKMAIICFVIYFFLAAGGVLPPIDFIPVVPYI